MKVYGVNDERRTLVEDMILGPGHDASRGGPNPNGSSELCRGIAPHETLVVEKLRWMALFRPDMVNVPTRRRTGRDTHSF